MDDIDEIARQEVADLKARVAELETQVAALKAHAEAQVWQYDPTAIERERMGR